MGRRGAKILPRFEAQHGFRYVMERKLCRECGRALTGRRTSWCSQVCVDAYLGRSDPAFQREALLRRDQGVCARCGLDTLAVQAACRRAISEWAQGKVPGSMVYPHGAPESSSLVQSRRSEILREILEPLGLLSFAHRKTFWDADHVVPFSEGGHALGVENLQTLCCGCHQGVGGRSSGQASKRASRKRGE